MFICKICEDSVGPKIKPVRVVVAEREQQYRNQFTREDEFGRKTEHTVDSIGKEIVEETVVCPKHGEEYFQITAGTQLKEPKPSLTFKEKLADQFTRPLFDCVIHTGLARTKHNSKRARRDEAVVIPLIKFFADTNKDYVA